MTDPLSSAIDDRLYTRRFFQVFGAVMLYMTSVALQFHFGQYVQFLGHGVDTLGVILSLAMAGPLLIRLHIGRWIDRFGCRPMWLAGALTAAAAVGTMQFTERVWLIILLRAVSTVSTGAVMTSVAVIAARIAPPRRRAESLGSMGLGGFTGMIVGATLGDYIFAGSVDTVLPYRVFFSTSAACSLLSAAAVLLIALPSSCGPMRSALSEPGAAQKNDHDGASTLGVIRKYWPGSILLISLAFGTVFCFQMAYLERLAEERGFYNIKVFFLVYAPTAMVLRIVFRRVPERLGRTRAVLGGMLLLATGVALLVGVRSQWQLVVPAVLMGAGHCFIFPSMIDLGAERLPLNLRGTGTALTLAAGDLGMLAGFLGLGRIIDRHGFDTALWTLVGTILTAALIFGVTRRAAVFGPRRTVARRGEER